MFITWILSSALMMKLSILNFLKKTSLSLSVPTVTCSNDIVARVLCVGARMVFLVVSMMESSHTQVTVLLM